MRHIKRKELQTNGVGMNQYEKWSRHGVKLTAKLWYNLVLYIGRYVCFCQYLCVSRKLWNVKRQIAYEERKLTYMMKELN